MKAIIVIMLSWLAFSATAEVINYMGVSVDLEKDYDKLRRQAVLDSDKIGEVKAKLYRGTQAGINTIIERSKTHSGKTSNEIKKLHINARMKMLSLTLKEWDRIPGKKRTPEALMLIYYRISRQVDKEIESRIQPLRAQSGWEDSQEMRKHDAEINTMSPEKRMNINATSN